MIYVNASSDMSTNDDEYQNIDWSAPSIMHMLEQRLQTKLQKLETQGAYGSVFLIRGSPGKIVKVARRADGEREADILQYIHNHKSQITCDGNVLRATEYVPRIYGHGTLGTLYFIVMEYIAHANTLQKVLDTSHTISTETLVSIRQGIERAIQSLFAANIYHGDLHANNILIRHGRVYIIDMGFATVVPGLSKYACSPATMPSSITQAMRKQHYKYGRFMLHNNLEKFIQHTDTLNAIINRRRVPLKNITQTQSTRRVAPRVPITKSPFA